MVVGGSSTSSAGRKIRYIKLGIFDTEQIVLVQGSNCLDKKLSQHSVLICERANLRLIQGLLCVIMQ